MSRKEAIKDLAIFLGIACAIAILFSVIAGVFDLAGFVAFFLFLGGVPAGWRWASHIITAVGPMGLLIKFTISIFLGWFAFVYTVVKDVYYIIVNKQPEQGNN